jgi:hypothetical protein
MIKLLLALALALFVSEALAQSVLPTTNGSVTITNGNAFQTVLTSAIGGPRRSLTIQNNNTNGDNCWVFVGGGTAAKGTSILLAQGASYTRYYPYIPSDAIQATCATTSDTLYVDTQ